MSLASSPFIRISSLPACLAAGLSSLLMVACGPGGEREGRQRPPAPVEVVAVEKGLIRNQRVFGGTLEASESFAVSPKVGGRIEALYFNLGDTVPRDALVARLDDDEFQQDLASAEAERMVARANLTEAESALVIAQRAIERAKALRKRGVASEAELDSARSELLAQEARVQVALAQQARAEAALEHAKIRVGYTELRASWRGEGEQRYVARRYLDEGQNIAANEALLQIVAIDPIVAVVYVTERDYTGLQIDQLVHLQTDAHPGLVFDGKIIRIAPVFEAASRQARVEVAISNPEGLLKPGMFVRVEVELARDAEATIVPFESIERRGDVTGIFLVSEDGTRARWHPVELGIREGGRVQLLGQPPLGRVIRMGQQLVEDGSAIRIVEGLAGEAAPSEAQDGTTAE